MLNSLVFLGEKIECMNKGYNTVNKNFEIIQIYSIYLKTESDSSCLSMRSKESCKREHIQKPNEEHSQPQRPVAYDKSKNTQDNELVPMGGPRSTKCCLWFSREFDIIFFFFHLNWKKSTFRHTCFQLRKLMYFHLKFINSPLHPPPYMQ